MSLVLLSGLLYVVIVRIDYIICLACCFVLLFVLLSVLLSVLAVLFYYPFSYPCIAGCSLPSILPACSEKLCGHKVFDREHVPTVRLPLFQNVSRSSKLSFSNHPVSSPGPGPFHYDPDNREFIHRCFFKLGLYGFGYFFS